MQRSYKVALIILTLVVLTIMFAIYLRSSYSFTSSGFERHIEIGISQIPFPEGPRHWTLTTRTQLYKLPKELLLDKYVSHNIVELPKSFYRLPITGSENSLGIKIGSNRVFIDYPICNYGVDVLLSIPIRFVIISEDGLSYKYAETSLSLFDDELAIHNWYTGHVNNEKITEQELEKLLKGGISK